MGAVKRWAWSVAVVVLLLLAAYGWITHYGWLHAGAMFSLTTFALLNWQANKELRADNNAIWARLHDLERNDHRHDGESERRYH